MRCEHDPDRLLALAMGVLPEASAQVVREQAARCAVCAAQLAEFEADEASLRAALLPAPPTGLEGRIKAAVAHEARSPRRWWVGIAAVCVVTLVTWLSWPKATHHVWVLDGRGAVLSEAALPAGPLTASRTTVVAYREARLRLAPGTQLEVADTLTLRRGDLWVTAAEPLTVQTAHGTVAVRGLARLNLVEAEQGGAVTRTHMILAAGVLGAGGLLVSVLAGEAELEAGGARAKGVAGQTVAAPSGGSPRVVSPATDPDRAALEAEVLALRRSRDAERVEVKRLKARLAVLEEAARTQAPELRPTAAVRTDLLALIKAQGMGIYGLSTDHVLFKELKAMGPEGISLLGDLLKTGGSEARFGAAALMEKLMDPSALPMLHEALFGGDNADNLLVQRMASHAIGKIGGAEAVPSLERLLDEGSEWGVKTNAAHFLAEMGRESGIDWLRESYASAKDATARLTILGSMAEVGDPSYLPVLHEVLTTETEYSKRYIAMRGVAKAARSDSLPILEAIISNPDEDQTIVTEAKKAYAEIKGE